jgi:hypothetical protein
MEFFFIVAFVNGILGARAREIERNEESRWSGMKGF